MKLQEFSRIHLTFLNAYKTLVFLLVFFFPLLTSAQKVLIIQDEMPQLVVLTKFLEEKGGLQVDIVDQQNLPEQYAGYQAIIGFVHGRLFPEAEKFIIDYTEKGGRYVCLHHSISSGKANNEYYFDFLGIRLDHPEYSRFPVKPGGGYGWYHDGDKGIALTLVNLHPKHFIVRNGVEWGNEVSYTSSDEPSVPGKFPSIVLPKTEVYMNHEFIDGREKTVLAGFKYFDPRNQELFMQDRAIWFKDYGQGKIFYFMPGHTPADYENTNISQMILNSIVWEP